MGAAGATGLVANMNLPEPVEAVLFLPFIAAFVIGAIGFTGAWDSASVVFCSTLGR